MRAGTTVAVIIPVLDEEEAIAGVVSTLPSWVDEIIVVDNGSSDRSAATARSAGARVVFEGRRGYGAACLRGITVARSDVLVFVDGDASVDARELRDVIEPIVRDEADLVIGSRALGKVERGALSPVARFGNRLACGLMAVLWGATYTDLGPFRAVRREALTRLAMSDRDYGWTVEMQVKALTRRVRTCEVPVSCRRRVGRSKISGTLKGIAGAATKILYVIFREALRREIHVVDRVSPARLILFARYPEAGRTKTRLIPQLGAVGAAELHRRMTNRVLAWAEAVREADELDVEVRFAGGSAELMRAAFGGGYDYRPQGAGELGTRMAEAALGAFREGCQKVVIIGSDCPALSPRHVFEALDLLACHDVVFGPAEDGGYYLIALRRPIREVFSGIAWGGDGVLEQSLAAARQAGVSVALLERLRDVDTAADLAELGRSFPSILEEPLQVSISVVIPTLDEQDCIARALESVGTGPGVEVLVVDGGSADETVARATGAGATCAVVAPGRARQLNDGARRVSGDIVLFLHADTVLPPAWDDHVRNAVARPSVVAGAFQLGINAPDPSLRLVELLANWRSRVLRMPYGDQAVFVRRDLFLRLGGFSELPIMEDFDLARRIRRRGALVTIPVRALTDARRWRRLGPLRATLLNQACIVAFLLGISPDRIAKWYRGRMTD